MRAQSPWPALFLLYVLFVVAPVLVSSSESQDQRPSKLPGFSDGFREYNQKNWQEAADHMTASLKEWEEDGELTRVYGRWFEPYLPRFYLGASLVALGCYQAAMEQLNETILNTREVKGTKKLKQQLESLKLESEEFLRQGIDGESSECDRWNNATESEEGEETHV